MMSGVELIVVRVKSGSISTRDLGQTELGLQRADRLSPRRASQLSVSASGEISFAFGR
jgi:hypothetical protein